MLLENGALGTVLSCDGKTAFVDIDGEEIELPLRALAAVSEFKEAGKEHAEKVPGTGTKKEVHANAGDHKEGILLMIKRIAAPGDTPGTYELSVYNGTSVLLGMRCTFHADREEQDFSPYSLQPGTSQRIMQMQSDMLHGSPSLGFVFNPLPAVPGMAAEFGKELRLKPKHFFNKALDLQIEKEAVHIVELFHSLPPEKESLRTGDAHIHLTKNPSHELLQKAELPDFVDLHIGKLVPDPSKLQAGEILGLQLTRFRSFLETALRLRVHKFYVVHGLGKGVLKQEIEKILKEYPEVVLYRNEYSPRFGFGATEILLEPES